MNRSYWRSTPLEVDQSLIRAYESADSDESPTTDCRGSDGMTTNARHRSMSMKVSSCQLGADAATASDGASSACASSTNVGASSHEDRSAIANSSSISTMCDSASSVHELDHCREADEQPSVDSTKRRTRHDARAGARPTRQR